MKFMDHPLSVIISELYSFQRLQLPGRLEIGLLQILFLFNIYKTELDFTAARADLFCSQQVFDLHRRIRSWSDSQAVFFAAPPLSSFSASQGCLYSYTHLNKVKQYSCLMLESWEILRGSVTASWNSAFVVETSPYHTYQPESTAVQSQRK